MGQPTASPQDTALPSISDMPPPGAPLGPSNQAGPSVLVIALVAVLLSGIAVLAVVLLSGGKRHPHSISTAASTPGTAVTSGGGSGSQERSSTGAASTSGSETAGSETTGSGTGTRGATGNPGVSVGHPSGIRGWPAGFAGYTVALASDTVHADATAAVRHAEAAHLARPGLVRSDQYASLTPGYWFVFSGAFSSVSAARAHVATAVRAGFSGAYVRRVER
jgi:hypothetical protein